METLSHALGTCGELHPNIFTISFLVLITYTYRKKIFRTNS